MEFEGKKRLPGSVSIVHDSDQYDFIKDIGSGSFGITRLMRNKQTDEHFAIKYIERGNPVSYNLKSKFCCFSLLKWFFGAYVDVVLIRQAN